MLSYLLSFVYRPKPAFSIKECEKILIQDNHSEDLTENDSHQNDDFPKDDYNFTTRKGTITEKNKNTYIIDGLYTYISESEEFTVGMTVSYQKLVEDGKYKTIICEVKMLTIMFLDKIVIYNVNEVDNDWEIHIDKDFLVTNRIMISKVEQRNGRNIFLNKDNLKFNLDNVSSEFVPIVGDWIEMEVKCEVDENTVDLSGKVIDIIKICPLKPHVINGQITYWDPDEKAGHINRIIFFNQDSLNCGYIPVLQDRVIAEVIESDQNLCRLRAVKLIPEHMKKKLENNNCLIDNKQIKESHAGLDITCSTVEFVKLGESKEVIITVKNSSQEVLKLLDVQLGEACTQLQYEKHVVPYDIHSEEKLDLKYQCTAKNVGISNELLLFKFENFTIGKYINIFVDINVENRNQSYKAQKVNFNNILMTKHTVIRYLSTLFFFIHLLISAVFTGAKNHRPLDLKLSSYQIMEYQQSYLT